jgi:hypothetical protein
VSGGAGRLALFLGPFLLLGATAGVLFGLSLRPGLDRRRRRLFGALWVLALLAGGPLWLLLAATLGLF